jgi:16S rRNA (guanine(527)-N(7))-methyltransferase RsmG
MSATDVDEFRSALEAAVVNFDLDTLLEEQSLRLSNHYAMLCRWNQKVNLTRIITPGDAATLHYAESLFGSRFIPTDRGVLDIGSGAGFPGLPLAVTRSDLKVIALEANQKKALFLKEAKQALQLTNFQVITARLEQFDWSSYEFLTSRALDQAEANFRAVIERMSDHQKLILYCTRELVEKLENHSKSKRRFEIHPVPRSEARIVAVISCI